MRQSNYDRDKALLRVLKNAPFLPLSLQAAPIYICYGNESIETCKAWGTTLGSNWRNNILISIYWWYLYPIISGKWCFSESFVQHLVALGTSLLPLNVAFMVYRRVHDCSSGKASYVAAA
ncbi:hypothetical protein [Victivallis vadensis]|uniref:hypothetical protein n=1 Tax=Victivallis vadensis TaxID=172901 RepID=UPI003AF63B04